MRLPTVARAAAALALPACLAAQNPPVTKDAPLGAAMPNADRGAFIIRMGSDTLGVERFVRTRERLEVEGVSRTPRTLGRTFSATYGPDGAARSFVLRSERADRGAPPTQAEATFGADTVRVNLTQGGPPRSIAVAARGAMPQLGAAASIALLESATMRFAASAAESLEVPMIFLGAPNAVVMTLRRAGGDSVAIAFPQQPPYYARVDPEGRILGLQGLETTQKIVVERVRDADVPALLAAFAQRDAAGGGVGVLSPADSASARVGAATVSIRYSRPALRGRSAVGGTLVPYGQVWRTGANAATTLTTDRDLDVGGTIVPAGRYTLWTLPTASGWQLIVSRLTTQPNGQPLWGTMYDASQDLARIRMTVSRSAEKLERFRITLDGGQLRLAWENTVATVPVIPAP